MNGNIISLTGLGVIATAHKDLTDHRNYDVNLIH